MAILDPGGRARRMESISPMDDIVVAPAPTSRVRKADLDEPPGPRLEQRLRRYLAALALPESLVDAWVEEASREEADGAEAFSRLRSLMAAHWREQVGDATMNDAAAAARFRVCRVFASEADGSRGCAPRVDVLFALPDIDRRTMVPEAWGE